MDTSTALAELSVETAPAAMRRALDRDGYAIVPEALTPDQVSSVTQRIAELAREEGDLAGHEVHLEAGAARLADLVNKGEEFAAFYSHPLVLAGIAHVLEGDLKLSSLNSRAALPGEGLQALHTDWSSQDGEPTGLGGFQVCNSIWLLDDFTAENGATRCVPGTHRSGLTPGEVMADPTAAHPDEILLLAPAGTAVIFNSHLWHGGTQNRSTRPRRAVHSYFTRRSRPQQLDQRSHLREQTRERLSDAVLHLLDADSSA